MYAVQGGGGGSAAIQPCSFALDVEWARTIIDKISQGMERAGNCIRKGIEMFSSGLDTFLRWFPIVPPWVRTLIQKALNFLAKVAQKEMQLRAKLVSLLKQLLGPWQIRSAGQNIIDCLQPKTFTFADNLQKTQLATARTWQSEASRDFFSAVRDQHDAAKGAAEGTKTFGQGVKTLGDEAVKTTLSFVADFASSVIAIVAAAVGLPTVVGTAPSAAAIIGLVAKILASIMVLVKSAISIASQANAFKTTASGAVPGGSWPDSVVN